MHCIATLPLVQDFCHHEESPNTLRTGDKYQNLKLNLTTLYFYNKDQLNLANNITYSSLNYVYASVIFLFS